MASCNATCWPTVPPMADRAREQSVAAARAVDEVRDGMLVGLGTGRTVAFAVRAIAARMRGGLKIAAAATSSATEALARSLGIVPVPFERVARVDLTIDGADEIDRHLRAIKGGGGALLREKVVAAASCRMIVIADGGKLVDVLGRHPLPVEVLPFAAASVERALSAFGVPAPRRHAPDGADYRTDQDAYIYDLAFGAIADPDAIARRLEAIPGIIGHGLFLGLVDAAYVADGENVRVLERPMPSNRR